MKPIVKREIQDERGRSLTLEIDHHDDGSMDINVRNPGGYLVGYVWIRMDGGALKVGIDTQETIGRPHAGCAAEMVLTRLDCD